MIFINYKCGGMGVSWRRVMGPSNLIKDIHLPNYAEAFSLTGNPMAKNLPTNLLKKHGAKCLF
jgi:hypothetical protein